VGNAELDVSVSLATPASATAVARIIRAGFPRDLQPFSIYGSRGYTRYVEALLKAGPLSDSKFLVGHPRGDDQSINGVAEVRHISGQPFLNQIVVTPESRGKGVGRALLSKVVSEAAGALGTLGLDVFIDNQTARTWYERLGFRAENRNVWLLVKLPGGRTSAPASFGRCQGLPQAGLCLEAFGFGQFTVETNTSSYTVGLLGDVSFRVTDATLLADASAIATLKLIGPSRSLLVIMDPAVADKVPYPARLLAESIRMRVEITALRSALDH
jgi:ribosomal protein S18 acetylase RimI-like enzyme